MGPSPKSGPVQGGETGAAPQWSIAAPIRALRLPGKPLGRQRGQISGPELLALLAQLVEMGPGKDAGVVEIVELDADGVVAHGLKLQDADMGPAGDDLFLRGAVTLDLGRGAFD